MYKALKYYKNLALRVLVLFFSLLTSSVFAQSKYDYLLHKTYAERVQLFDTVTLPELNKLDSAAFSRELEKIEQLAIKEHDDGLLMEAKLGYTNLTTDDYYEVRLKNFEDLLAEAIDKKLKYYEVGIRFLYGQYLFDKHIDYEKSFEYYTLCTYDLANLSVAEMPNKKAILTLMAISYYDFSDYNTAKELLLQADNITNGWRKNITYTCKNTLGLIYRNNRMYDSAIYYFNQIIDDAQKSGLEVWTGIAKGNIGGAYYEQGNFDRAIPYITYDVDTSFAYGQYNNGIIALSRLIDIYIKQGKTELAAQYLSLGWRYIDSVEVKVPALTRLYTAQANVYRAKGLFEMAHIYRDSADKYADSSRKIIDVMSPSRIKKRIDEDIHARMVEKLNYDKKSVIQFRNNLIISLILLSVIAYLIINRQRSRHKTQQTLLRSEAELAHAERQLVETKLESATEQLNRFTKHLQEKSLLLEQSADTLNTIEKNRGSEMSAEEQNLTLQQLLNATILTDDEWDEFKSLFEKVHVGYIERIKNKYPELSPADLRFIVLSKLKLSNKEMAAILGVQADTMRTYKYRFRKKLGIDKDDDLADIIHNT